MKNDTYAKERQLLASLDETKRQELRALIQAYIDTAISDEGEDA